MNTHIPNNGVVGSLFSTRWLINMLLGIMMLHTQSNCCAQGTLYTDRAVFNAALLLRTTIDFNSLTPSSRFSTGTSPILASGVTITNADSRLFVCNQSTGIYPISGNGQYIWNFDSSYPVGIYLPTGKNAFGADFSGGIVQNNPFNATLTFTLFDGQTFTHNFTGQLGSWTFLGFVFSQKIRNVVYSDGGQVFPGAHEEMLDNVTIGFAVPEPQTALLLVFGILSSFWVIRLRDQK